VNSSGIKVPRDIEAKKRQLAVLASKYSRIERQLELDEIQSENRSLTLAPRYIQMG
jgi:hypothetical protein